MVPVAFCAQNRRFETFKRLIGTIDRGFSTVCKMSPPVTNSRERYCYNPILYWHPQVEEYFVKAYGADHFARISKVLTYPSCYSCVRVNTLKTTREAIIQKLTEMLQNESYAGTANDINICNGNAENYVDGDVGGSTKDQGYLHNPGYHDKTLEGTYLLNGCLKGEPVAKCPISGLDEVVFVQGTGPHKIDYDCATGKPLKEVIVSRKCAESVLRGAQIYVPGVLACSCHVEEGDKVAVSVAVEQPEPEGKWGAGITRGIVLQGSQMDPQYFQRKGMYIGEGTAMMSRAGIFRSLQGVAISMTNRVFNLPSFNNVLKGEIFLQNLPSIVTAHVLDPQKGERILDMCAAPGGKTTAIAMLMKNEGQVVATDRSHNKVHEIQKLASEMGLKSITTYKLDALKSVSRINQPEDNMGGLHHAGNDSTSDLSLSRVDCGGSNEEDKLNRDLVCEEKQSCGNENVKISPCMTKSKRKKSPLVKNGPGKNHTSGARVEISKGFTPNSFDRVLLDAPCSALGLRPRLFAGEETIESLQSDGKYQRKMFDQAVQLVRPGGVIVYSTCTINPGENEALVRYALDTYKFLSLAPQHPRVGGAGLVGSYTFSDGRVEQWLRPGEENLVQRFDPSVVDTIGFFIAKFNVDLKDA